MKALEALAKFYAILGGILLTAITLLTCFSLIGRNTFGITLAGDFELTGVVAGAAIALFLPICQWRRGNIIVDFFTAKASAQTNSRLDRLGSLLMAFALGLMAWRTTVGGLSAWGNQSGTMMLGFPEWIVYTCLVPPLILTALIALWQAISGFDQEVAA